MGTSRFPVDPTWRPTTHVPSGSSSSSSPRPSKKRRKTIQWTALDEEAEKDVQEDSQEDEREEEEEADVLPHGMVRVDVVELLDPRKSAFGLTIWSSAIVLAHFLAREFSCPENTLENQVVLELGAGLALPSLTAAKLNAKHVIATDVEQIVDMLRSNAEFMPKDLNGIPDAQFSMVRRHSRFILPRHDPMVKIHE